MPIVDHSRTLPFLRRTYNSKTSPMLVKWRRHRPKERGMDRIRQDTRLHRRADLRFFSLLQDVTTNTSTMERFNFFATNVIPRDEQ